MLHLELTNRVVVMLAPLTLFQVVNHKTIVALLFTLAFVCLNTFCNFTCRHFHKLLLILVPTNCTKALGFVMWITYSEIYSLRCQVPLQHRQLPLTRRGVG